MPKSVTISARTVAAPQQGGGALFMDFGAPPCPKIVMRL